MAVTGLRKGNPGLVICIAAFERYWGAAKLLPLPTAEEHMKTEGVENAVVDRVRSHASVTGLSLSGTVSRALVLLRTRRRVD
jgi:hypothetical protein